MPEKSYYDLSGTILYDKEACKTWGSSKDDQTNAGKSEEINQLYENKNRNILRLLLDVKYNCHQIEELIIK